MNTLEDARAWGFVGFKTVAALKKEVDCIPQTKGVYLVLRKEISFPEFAEVGRGGFFKGKGSQCGYYRVEKQLGDGNKYSLYRNDRKFIAPTDKTVYAIR